MAEQIAIGLMSGTSMDGIDVALLSTDGDQRVTRGPSMFYSYRADMRQAIERGIEDAVNMTHADERPGTLRELEQKLTEDHAQAVLVFLEQCKMKIRHVDVVGFHGQTVLHRPQSRLTVQLGDGKLMAEMLRKPVVYDFRAADVAAGGQGAPFVPAYHRALASQIGERPLAIVNLGGVGNVTYIGRDDTVLAFDTGPANALIDDWTKRHTGRLMDRDGYLASKGQVDMNVLMQMLAHPYFDERPPKSLDRNDFKLDAALKLSVHDGARTLTAFTAYALARAAEHFPEAPHGWIIAGGGRHNPVLMEELKTVITQPIITAEKAGFDGDSTEAEAFAYLAVRSRVGLPLSYPTTTGVPQALTGGRLAEV
ncbi:MAG: anhydro-N-acetylmuramic acid kinase [Pseudomonadota bacterium]